MFEESYSSLALGEGWHCGSEKLKFCSDTLLEIKTAVTEATSLEWTKTVTQQAGSQIPLRFNVDKRSIADK